MSVVHYIPSLRTLAARERADLAKDGPVADRWPQDVFIAVILELAHAISRGRKPSSCSLLPGVNIREWLYKMYTEVQHGRFDNYGEEVTQADDAFESLSWDYQDPSAQKIMRAIQTVRRFVPKQRVPLDLRGDWKYQDSHPVTNLKRKKAWLARNLRENSHYADDPRYYE